MSAELLYTSLTGLCALGCSVCALLPHVCLAAPDCKACVDQCGLLNSTGCYLHVLAACALPSLYSVYSVDKITAAAAVSSVHMDLCQRLGMVTRSMQAGAPPPGHHRRGAAAERDQCLLPRAD